MNTAVMTEPMQEKSPLLKARAAGLWLMTILTGMFGFCRREVGG